MQCPDCEGHGHYHPSVALERGGDGTCEACDGTGVLGGVPVEVVSAPAHEEDAPPVVDDDTQ